MVVTTDDLLVVTVVLSTLSRRMDALGLLRGLNLVRWSLFSLIMLDTCIETRRTGIEV